MNEYSPAKKIGELIAAEFQRDPHFYFFSPDETTSNKFDQIFTVERRAWDLPRESWDLPEGTDGRIVEMLSENVLFSVMTGHLANGETAMMGSYESFWPVVTSQILQQIKFIKQAKAVAWRQPMPAVNLLSTSTCWRQDHNGFTHQSPALISTLLSVPSNLANCFFPVDDAAATAVYNYMIRSTDVVNLATFSKVPLPRYLAPEMAMRELNEGAAIYGFASADRPDVVLAAAGDLMANEVLQAIKLLSQDLPEARVRFVYINTLSYGGIGRVDRKMSVARFKELFTPDRPIIAVFHGYPATLQGILANYTALDRVQVRGYREEGSTTTPHEMLRRNGVSRYDLATEVAKMFGREDLALKYQRTLTENHAFAVKYGKDTIK